MPHASLDAVASDLRLHLVTLAMLFVSALTAVSAHAVPYRLRVTLADSSGHETTGTQVVSFHPSSVSETLFSTTFGNPHTDPVGSYEGTARASSDGFTVRLFASAEFTDYLPGSYVFSPVNGGIDFAATATANYTDTVTISGPPELVVLHLSFGVTGTLIRGGASAQLCHGFVYGGPIVSGVCLPETVLPPIITVESTPFVPDGTPRPLNFEFSAVVFNEDDFVGAPYSGFGIADLESTIVLEELLVTSLDDEPIPGIRLTSAGGFDYPLSPLNRVAAAVPAPATYALMLAGLGLLGFMARRRTHPIAHANLNRESI